MSDRFQPPMRTLLALATLLTLGCYHGRGSPGAPLATDAGLNRDAASPSLHDASMTIAPVRDATVDSAVTTFIPDSGGAPKTDANNTTVKPADTGLASSEDAGPTTNQPTCAAITVHVVSPGSCDFSLNTMISMDASCTGSVTLNGSKVPCNASDGWALVAPDRIRLNGLACQTYQNSSTVLVGAQFPCSSRTDCVC